VWLVLLALLALMVRDSATGLQQVALGHPTVFELELPELGIAPTDQPDLTIPSRRVSQILIHILNPYADDIDYSQIFAFLNGEATGRIHEVIRSERGKSVRLYLNRWPGFELISGRNTVEVRAHNRRGRVFYASFVLHTTTNNRNFVYRVALGKDPQQQVPPELALLEPERQIELQPGQKSRAIHIAGVATAASTIDCVTVDGGPLPLKRGQEITLRKIGLAHEENRVTFDSPYAVAAGATQVVVEAIDAAGNRTQLQIPVRVRKEGPPEEFRGRKYALVIGISQFHYHEGGLNNLQYADADARAVYQFLQTPGGGRFSSENILLLMNAQATVTRVRDALVNFIARPGPDDLLLIFLASHGDSDPYAQQNLYFLMHDTQVDRMPDTALAMRDFQMLLQQNVRARRLVLLIDTCHSAGVTGARGEMARGIRNNLVNLYVEKLLYREEGSAIITSSDINEISRESPNWGGGHGVFTYYLLEGMRGKADENADHLVTVGELFRFVRLKVRLETQFLQNPRMLAGANEELTLAAVASPVSRR
jgi:hypothetical protein